MARQSVQPAAAAKQLFSGNHGDPNVHEWSHDTPRTGFVVDSWIHSPSQRWIQRAVACNGKWTKLPEWIASAELSGVFHRANLRIVYISVDFLQGIQSCALCCAGLDMVPRPGIRFCPGCARSAQPSNHSQADSFTQ